MKKIFGALLDELEGGRDAVLVSVIASSGSSPRGAGSKMLVTRDGRAIGTVGGGAVELNAAREAALMFGGERSRVESYRLAPGEVRDIGMICGGDVTLHYQLVEHGDARALAMARRACELLAAGGNAWLVTMLERDAPARMGVYDATGGLQFVDGLPMDALAPMLGTRAALRQDAPACFVEPLSRAGAAYIFGGGHVGRALAPVLAGIGLRVTVFDDRERVARPEVFPTAERVVLGDYDDVSARVTLEADDCVIVMTPGHQADYAVLRQALRSPATYIGCIGSRRKAAATRERLLADGFAAEDVARVHSPIGLAIGAETPEEIAISIAAQLIAHRAAGRSVPPEPPCQAARQPL